MSADVLMPQLGETVAEGKILTWFKQEGDEVSEGDNLFEIETDKVTMEVQSTVAGRLGEIRVKSGEVAKVGAVVAVIGGAAKPAAASEPARSEPAKPAPVSAATVAPTSPQAASGNGAGHAAPTRLRSPFEEVSTPIESFGPAKGPSGIRVTPLARRLIAQNGLDTEAIARTVAAAGATKIGEKDVRAALAAPRSQPAAVQSSPAAPQATRPAVSGSVVTLNTIRKRTGERLAENWRTIPHVFQAIEVDFTQVEAVRSKRKERFKSDFGLSLTYLPFIARATCLALRDFPEINAQLDGGTLVLASEINLGIAVDLSHNGLVVPVVRNADDLTLPGLARAIGRQVEKARAGKLTGDDFSGGTYSISNNGAFGTAFTAPIINAPQVAILSTDAIRLRASVVETPQGAFVAPRLTGMVGQSFDHRAFDGAYSAAFLSRLKAVLEERDWGAEFA
ncbi:2-oxo acid dehydrogenase subunit E2 [Mesorhizobium sp. YC-39]|uniref:dihydrolipoamide acetyltransferase family protein n=1 Tax=unclassified Mesorhizobium TaxID=325217 RepID=UPI0021E7DD5D|nr:MULTISPECIES: dihydrolipoamide acetyltransferase family protein [unclassified Mesorhizobium]MCV3206612.1 2-oxo acid dehydrogenase subunit E2 [Mesorhizobium sp. YC-2]MCV3226988.1 2-oxo acid dehydrogenase subunit E2 [Mesorhizobium sp. YC-39]